MLERLGLLNRHFGHLQFLFLKGNTETIKRFVKYRAVYLRKTLRFLIFHIQLQKRICRDAADVIVSLVRLNY